MSRMVTEEEVDRWRFFFGSSTYAACQVDLEKGIFHKGLPHGILCLDCLTVYCGECNPDYQCRCDTEARPMTPVPRARRA